MNEMTIMATKCNECGVVFDDRHPKHKKAAKCIPCARAVNTKRGRELRARENLTKGSYVSMASDYSMESCTHKRMLKRHELRIQAHQKQATKVRGMATLGLIPEYHYL